MAAMTIEQMRQTLNNATKAIFPDHEWRVTGKPDDPHLRFASKNGDMLLDPKIHDVLKKAFEDAGFNGPHNINDLVRPTSTYFSGNIPGRSFSLREHSEIVSIFPRLAQTDWIKPFTESLKSNIDQFKAETVKRTAVRAHIDEIKAAHTGGESKPDTAPKVTDHDYRKFKLSAEQTASIPQMDHEIVERTINYIREGRSLHDISQIDFGVAMKHLGTSAVADEFTDRTTVDKLAKNFGKYIQSNIAPHSRDVQERVLEKLAQILGKGMMKVIPITALGIAAHERMGLEEASAALVREGVLTQDDADRYKTGVLESSVGFETVDPTVVIAEGVAHLRYRNWLGGLSPEKREAVAEKLAPSSVIKDGFAAIKDVITGWAGPGDNTGAMSSYDGLVQASSALDRNVSPEFKTAAVGKAGEGSTAPEIKPDLTPPKL